MQFSNTSDASLGLYQDAQARTGTDSNAFLIADFTRWANRWYYKAVIEAMRSSSTWRFDDTNQTGNADDDAGRPVATSDLTNSQKAYSLPTGALKIRRVEVQDNGNNWSVVYPITEREITQSLSEFQETDGLPKYYILEGDRLRLYPAPATAQVTLTNGLRIYFEREIDEFTTGDTTQEPGLPEPYHHILSVGAAYDFAVSKGLNNVNFLKAEVDQLFVGLRKHFSDRHTEPKLRLRPHIVNYV